MAVAQPSTSVAEYGWVASPVKAGLRPPPSAAEGLDRAFHPATVCHQAFDGEARLKSGQMACQFFSLRQIYADPDSHPHPRDPSMFLWLPGGAIAHLLAGRPEQAIQWTEDALRLNPRHLISLFLRVAAEMTAGQSAVARRYVERMRAINPALDVKFASKMLPFKFADDKQCILSALRAAGLPN